MVRTYQFKSRRIAIALAGGLLLAAAGMALPAVEAPASQPAHSPDDDRRLEKWLADLASAESSVRETARTALISLPRADLPRLQNVVRRRLPLAPSQATALRQIVREVYLKGEPYVPELKDRQPVAFLGVLMDKASLRVADLPPDIVTPQAPGIVITERIPGFCASRMLRDGDVILGTVKPRRMFSDSNDLKFIIQSLPPGSNLHFQVLREGQVIEVTVTLDVHPLGVSDEPSAYEFAAPRAAKFNKYWAESFGPLLKEVAG